METNYQEALNQLKCGHDCQKCEFYQDGNCTDVNPIAISALQELVDKQTPKKALERHYEDKGEKPYIKVCCPNGCHVQVGSYYKYCPECAQKLDWSDEDE